MTFTLDAADRVAPLQPQAEADASGPDIDAFRRDFGHWVELFPHQMMHGGTADGTWARLDRVYSSLPLGSWAGQSTTYGDGDGHGTLSDH